MTTERNPVSLDEARRFDAYRRGWKASTDGKGMDACTETSLTLITEWRQGYRDGRDWYTDDSMPLIPIGVGYRPIANGRR